MIIERFAPPIALALAGLVLGAGLLLASCGSAQAQAGEGGEAMAVDFGDPDEAGRWFAVNDGVMGGVSRGGMTVVDGVGVFAGRLSLENNGGFSSVWRRPDDLGLGGARGVALRARGDGRTYTLRLETPDLPDGVSYQARFATTAGEWSEHELPFADFVARFRGRRVDVRPLDPTDVRRIGLLLADGNPGNFRLELEWIRPYG